jgi:hypothetical protein
MNGERPRCHVPSHSSWLPTNGPIGQGPAPSVEQQIEAVGRPVRVAIGAAASRVSSFRARRHIQASLTPTP